MGGGDLNSKKSWHPNTMKNQERVWKAEQAAAEEKKRILELQHMHSEERERAELNDMVKNVTGASSDNCLNWMYDKPDKKVQDEDYLLGKSIGKNYGNTEKDDNNVIPAVARRVVGSSMLASAGDGQVDLARKIREDPLLLVKERERAARAALLNNPLHRKRLADLLRKEQEQRKEKPKKKAKKKSKDLDNILAEKLSALSGDKGIDITKLLDSGDSSSDSDDSSDRKPKKKKHKHKEEKNKKKSKKKKSKPNHSSDTSEDESDKRHKQKASDRHSCTKVELRKRKDSDTSDEEDSKRKRRKAAEKSEKEYKTTRHPSDASPERSHFRRPNKDLEEQSGSRRYKSDKYNEYKEKEVSRRPLPDTGKRDAEKRAKGLSDEEKAARLAAMAAAGAEREVERGRRVAEQRRADHDDERRPRPPRASGHEARALPDSLESRIHSNRHYIQRDRHHMNQHFARR